MISYEPRRSEDGNQTRMPHETLGTESTIPTADLPWVHGRLRKLSAALLSLSIRLEMFSKYFTDRCFTEVTSLSSSRDGACAELRSVFQDCDAARILFSTHRSSLFFVWQKGGKLNHAVCLEDDRGHPGRSGFVYRSCDSLPS